MVQEPERSGAVGASDSVTPSVCQIKSCLSASPSTPVTWSRANVTESPSLRDRRMRRSRSGVEPREMCPDRRKVIVEPSITPSRTVISTSLSSAPQHVACHRDKPAQDMRPLVGSPARNGASHSAWSQNCWYRVGFDGA